MLISLNWLKKYVDIKEDINELTKALTMIGQEVESIEIQGENLKNVVIGEIVEYDRHPDADKLTVLKVNVGDENLLDIVCGATNHKLGDKVVVAKIGAVLQGDFKIKKNKIRGIESQGMLCSEAELGLGEASEGIIILPEDATIGEEYRKYLSLNDIIFELEITPNRPDCLSHIGIAREVAAYYGRKVKYPIVNFNETVDTTGNHIKINIIDKTRCKRYVGRLINNIKVEASPEWLQKRILSMGLKPVNNIVDITNFVMFEYNQPLHAFDFNKISGGIINVREASLGEKIITLDGEERELNNSELVIADAGKAVAIAGIIGGENTKVSEETTSIFLECAYFTPENIRKTSKSLGISTDSSYRNERGLDIDNLRTASDRAVSLILEIAGGDVLSDRIDLYLEKYNAIEIPVVIGKLNRFIGKVIDFDIIGQILSNLNIEAERLNEKTILVTPPSYRGDLTRAADIYEEIIRMYGFENIEAKMPEANIDSGIEDESIKLSFIAKKSLTSLGLNEVINYSFIPENVSDILSLTSDVIHIKNPITEDMAVMRTTTMYSLLTNIRDNLNRNEQDLKLYEVSKVFFPGEETEDSIVNEELRIGIALAGKANKSIWDPTPTAYNFYTIKAYVETLLSSFGVKKYSIVRSEDTNFHPGRSADIMIGNELIASFGEVHPNVADKMAIKKERVYFAEINLHLLKKYINFKKKYERLSKYPAVNRDLAIVMDKEVLVGSMLKDLKKKIKLIETIDVFDVYEGEKIEAGKKSVAISIILRDKKKTLSDVEIENALSDILKLIKDNYKGEIR